MTLRADLELLNEAELTFVASHLLEEIEASEGHEPSADTSPDEKFRAEMSYLQSVLKDPNVAQDMGAVDSGVAVSKKAAAIELLVTLAEISPELETKLRQSLEERHAAGKQLVDPVTGIGIVLVAIAFAIVRPNLNFERDASKKRTHTKLSFKIEGTKQIGKVIAAVGKLMPSVLPRGSNTADGADC